MLRALRDRVWGLIVETADMPAAGPGGFDAAFEAVVGHEGGYSDDPADRGNWTGGAVGRGELRGTKFGISAASYPTLDIRNLTLAQARDIYRRDYWGRLECDRLPAAVALVVFDAGVNAGVRAATGWLQAALGVTADGVIGPVTRAAMDRLRGDPERAEAVLVDVLALRNLHNAALPSWGRYGKGWSRRLFRLALQAARTG